VLSPEYLSLFIFTYLFNLSTFFIYSKYVALNISPRSNAHRALEIYFYALLAGLPITAAFFIKLRFVVELYRNNNIWMASVCLILLILSLYIYWVVVSTHLNNYKLDNLNKINKKDFFIDSGSFNISMLFVAINIIYNIFFLFYFLI